MKDKEFDEPEFKSMVDNILIYYPLFYRKIKTSMNEKKLKYDKTLGYYQILGTLVSLGPLAMSEIGEKLYISKPNMTSLIDRLVKEGMVKRSRSDEDRRIVYVEITDAGRNFLSEAREVVEENIKENLSVLDETDFKTLNESLNNIKDLVLKINPK